MYWKVFTRCKGSLGGLDVSEVSWIPRYRTYLCLPACLPTRDRAFRGRVPEIKTGFTLPTFRYLPRYSSLTPYLPRLLRTTYFILTVHRELSVEYPR